MKTLILLALIAFVAAEPKYYILGKIDINKLITDMDNLQEFTNCLLEKIPCNNLYEDYRANTLEAIQQACKKCFPYVKHNFGVYLETLKTKLPVDYLGLRHKYDPDNKYFDAHEAELQKYLPESFKL